MNIGYEVNHIEGTIIVSKKFLKAAGVLNSTEYNILRQLRLDNPEYKIAPRKKKKKEGLCMSFFFLCLILIFYYRN